MEKLVLEAPVFTIEAALKAAEVGVDRLELCADFGSGGTTPSAGTLAMLKEQIDIPIFVMIRPRGGDFLYSDQEILAMIKDIELLSSLCADGFVFGALTTKGEIDKETCKRLLKAAGNKSCTFHRAFDMCVSQEKALEELITLGFGRILTSGGANDVTKGQNQILKLLDMAKTQISIMPGGGLKPEHVERFRDTGFLQEIHSSCKTTRASQSVFRHPDVNLSSDPANFYQQLTIDEALVSAFNKVLM